MSETRIDIEGLDKGELLAALYNAASPQGRGLLQTKPGVMTPGEAREKLAVGHNDMGLPCCEPFYFDYLYGRPLKVDLKGSTLDTRLYNRDQGEGKAERVVWVLRHANEDGRAAENILARLPLAPAPGVR